MPQVLHQYGKAADVLQPLQAWLRLICVLPPLLPARGNHSVQRANFAHRSKIRAIFALNGFVSHELQTCQRDPKEEPPPSSPLTELDMAMADYRCRLAKSKLLSTPEAVTEPLPKSSATLTLASGCEYEEPISFPPTRRFFSNYYSWVL